MYFRVYVHTFGIKRPTDFRDYGCEMPLDAAKATNSTKSLSQICDKGKLNHDESVLIGGGPLVTSSVRGKINLFPSLSLCSSQLFLNEPHSIFFSHAGAPKQTHDVNPSIYYVYFALSLFITYWKCKPQFLAMCLLAGH